MNTLQNAINSLKDQELVTHDFPFHGTGLVDLNIAIKALEDLEIAVRNECDCEQLKQEVDEAKL